VKVILLVIDTLRADHLGCYGYHHDTSPTIDHLAEEGVLFENAYPTDVPTQPSFTSMFTGLRGVHTGIVSHSETERLSERIPCFPEILLQQVDAEEINAMALPWIKDNADKDFFIFIHYWDPHGLYLPPERYRRLFYEGDECDPENKSLNVLKSQPVWPFTKGHLDALKKGITDIEYVVAQYDGEIRYADDNVKELLLLLDELGITEETAVILTSDHGESLGEHHFYFDHHEVYETTVHVPLIMRYPPDIPKGTKVNGLVQSTICLAPTILNLFGIECPSDLEGRDLVQIANGEQETWNEIYVNQGLWTAKRAIRTERWKLIKTLDPAFWETPETELYDMKSDPDETRNLADEMPDVMLSMTLNSEW